MIERDALRRDLRRRREASRPAERIAAAAGLAAVLQQLPDFLVDTHIAGYWAVGGELPLHAALAGLDARGQRYHLPVLLPGKRLAFAPWRMGDPLQPNRYGIPEPVPAEGARVGADALDLVLVPLLGFDRRGQRLGTGGGFYDRSFAFLKSAPRPTRPLLVGIGYSFAEVDSLPPRDWDIQMDFVATERELIDCTGAAT